MTTTKREREQRTTAGNWRFGASGGVAPRKVQWEYERLCPE
jgi:hypothetical protein